MSHQKLVLREKKILVPEEKFYEYYLRKILGINSKKIELQLLHNFHP